MGRLEKWGWTNVNLFEGKGGMGKGSGCTCSNQIKAYSIYGAKTGSNFGKFWGYDQNLWKMGCEQKL